jgi:hypothetical protein
MEVLTSKEVAKELNISVSDLCVLARLLKIGMKHKGYESFKFTLKDVRRLKFILAYT